jgi:hypothetical protein
MPDAPTRTKRGLDPATAAELGDLLHELSANKDTRKLIAKAIKKVKPDSPHAAAFGDVDVEEKFETLEAEREAKELERQQQEVVRRMNSQRARLLSGEGGRKYDEDTVKKIEDLMQKKGVTDYDDGATLYAATLPPEDPKPGKHEQPAGTTWEFPDWAKFGKDPNKAARDTAHTVIGEFMRKRA